jgi:hypothetical protein
MRRPGSTCPPIILESLTKPTSQYCARFRSRSCCPLARLVYFNFFRSIQAGTRNNDVASAHPNLTQARGQVRLEE